MKDKLILWIGVYGFWVGIALYFLPIITDLIWHGAREWNLINVGMWGELCQFISVLVMIVGVVCYLHMDKKATGS